MKLRLLSVLILSGLLLPGCGADTETGMEPETETAAEALAPTPEGTREDPYVGRGVIREIEENSLVIEHETIPGLMPGMTMSFPVTEEVDTTSLAVGDQVTFDIEMLDPEGYRVFRVEPEEE